MRIAELAGLCTRRAPGLDEVAFAVEFDDAVVAARTMAVGDEDVTIGSDQHIGRLIEYIVAVARNARLAKAHEHVAVRAELPYLMATISFATGIGYPDVAVGINMQAVWPRDQPGTEALEQIALSVELQNRIDILATDAAVLPAALANPDRAVDAGIDRARRAPLPALRQLAPAIARPVRMLLRQRLRRAGQCADYQQR